MAPKIENPRQKVKKGFLGAAPGGRDTMARSGVKMMAACRTKSLKKTETLHVH